MAIPLVINGATFEYPENFDENWGIEATGWAQAVTNGMLQMQGGSFPLTSDVNFGPNFGLLSKYFETRSANPSTVGTVRLSSADAGIGFRNNANSANLILTTNSSDQLTFNGSAIAFTGAVNPGVQYQLGYYATSSNVISPNPNTMAGTQVLVSDANGVPTTTGNGGTTATEIGFVHSVTSSIQTQLNTLTSTKLSLTGGTMSGAIAMGSNKITDLAAPTTTNDALSYGHTFDMGSSKITGLANGTVSTDAATFGQSNPGRLVAHAVATSSTSTAVTSSTYSAVGPSLSYSLANASNLIRITLTGNIQDNTGQSAFSLLTLFKDSTNILPTAGYVAAGSNGNSALSSFLWAVTIIFLYAPGDTSAHTYQGYLKTSDNTSTFRFSEQGNAQILIEEISQ